jgi:hypothetical protein
MTLGGAAQKKVVGQWARPARKGANAGCRSTSLLRRHSRQRRHVYLRPIREAGPGPSTSSPPSPGGPPAASAAGRPSASRTFSAVSCATGRRRYVPTPHGPRWATPSAATSPAPSAATACTGSGTRSACYCRPWAAYWPARTGPQQPARYRGLRVPGTPPGDPLHQRVRTAAARCAPARGGRGMSGISEIRDRCLTALLGGWRLLGWAAVGAVSMTG